MVAEIPWSVVTETGHIGGGFWSQHTLAGRSGTALATSPLHPELGKAAEVSEVSRSPDCTAFDRKFQIWAS